MIHAVAHDLAGAGHLTGALVLATLGVHRITGYGGMAKPTRFRSQLLKGTTALLVLTVLGDGELYGYEIGRRLRERSGGAFAMAESSLYPALHRLEAEGALSATWRAGDRGPRRRYYRLTPRGHRMLEAHGRDWEAVVRGVRSVRSADAHD